MKKKVKVIVFVWLLNIDICLDIKHLIDKKPKGPQFFPLNQQYDKPEQQFLKMVQSS